MNWKRGVIALLLSALLAGLGQVYNRKSAKAIVFLLIPIVSVLVAGATGLTRDFRGLVAFVFVLLVSYFWSLVDAFIGGLKHDDKAAVPKANRLVQAVAVIILVVNIAGGTNFYTRRLLGIQASVMSSSQAMLPTVKPGDRVVSDLRAYSRNSPHRGDLVLMAFPTDEKAITFKRVIAIGGDTIEGTDEGVTLNGKLLQLLYPSAANDPIDTSAAGAFARIVVPAGTFFVIGDNVRNSNDSRYFGPVPARLIHGKPLFIYWSPDRSRIGQNVR